MIGYSKKDPGIQKAGFPVSMCPPFDTYYLKDYLANGQIATVIFKTKQTNKKKQENPLVI